MIAPHRTLRVGIVVAVVALTLSGVSVAAQSGSLEAEPMESGASATHTLTVTVDDRSAGQWTGLSVDYSESGANPGQITAAAVPTIGIDRDDDARGDEIDVDAADSLTGVSAESRGELTFELDGSHSIEAGDEIVVRYIGVYNPASDGDYQAPIDVNPSVAGGETEARLMIGTNRATVLVDDQSTTGDTVTVSSVTVPNGGFVVLHDKEALGAGSGNPDAITAESVVGTSAYLSAGSHDDVTVDLSGQIDEETTYVAMVVKDQDGDESYAADTDRPYLVGGNPIWEGASFTIHEPTATPTDTATATETTDTQTETEAEVGAETEESQATTSASSPGFGVVLSAVVALATVLVGARRRRR
jgi:hypothetical protein